DLARADAVAGGLEDVVAAALVREVAVAVHGRGVAGAAPAVVGVAGELVARRVVALPVAEEEDRIALAVNVAPVQGDVARRSPRALPALVVDHGDAVARVRSPHAARVRRPAHGAVADDVVNLGLAEHLVRDGAERVSTPGEDGVADVIAG